MAPCLPGRLSRRPPTGSARSCPGWGVTLAPGRARISPSMMMRSPASRPVRTTRRPSSWGPGRITRGVTTLSFPDRQHDLARLVRDDGAVRDQHRRIEGRARQPQPAELAGRDEIVGVVDDRPAPQRAGALVDLVVDEVHRSRMRPGVLVGQADRDGCLVIARGGQLAAQHGPLIAEEVGLAHVEDEVDRIEGHDGGEQRGAGVAGHEIADVDATVGDPPFDRGPHLGVSQIQLCLVEMGHRRGEIGVGLALLGQPLVQGGLRQRRGGDELAGPVELELGQLRPRPGAVDRGLRLLDGDLIGPGVDHEQQLALLDDLAVREADGLQVARDPGAHVDPLERLEPAGELVIFRELLDQGLGHRHRRRRWCRPLRVGGPVVALATGAECQRRDDGRRRAHRPGRTPPRPESILQGSKRAIQQHRSYPHLEQQPRR